MIDLILPPLLMGCCLAIISGPLGCFIVWRRMAYFGDTIAHAALLGIGLSVLLTLNHTLLTIVTCVGVSAQLSFKHKFVSNDTTLGVIAHGSLALGLLIISVSSNSTANISTILLGDILNSNSFDVAVMAITATIILIFLKLLWSKLLLCSIDEGLAQTDGLKPQSLKFAFMIMVSTTVALGITLIGALLISSLLIIPAASARFISRSPEAMALNAAFIGILSVAFGISLSALFNIPTGPSIVSSSLCFFVLAILIQRNKAS